MNFFFVLSSINCKHQIGIIFQTYWAISEKIQKTGILKVSGEVFTIFRWFFKVVREEQRTKKDVLADQIRLFTQFANYCKLLNLWLKIWSKVPKTVFLLEFWSLIIFGLEMGDLSIIFQNFQSSIKWKRKEIWKYWIL